MTKFIFTPVLTLLMISVAQAAEKTSAAGEETLFAGTILQSMAAIISFLILLAILYKFAWGPILSGLQDREGKIKGDLEAAEKASKDAQAALAEYQTKLAQAQESSRKIIEEGRNEAQRLSAQLKDQTLADIKQIKEKSVRDIEAAKQQAITELYTEAAALGTQIAGRILKRELNAQDQQDIVEESLAQLKAQSN